jgi:hypothetical protein
VVGTHQRELERIRSFFGIKDKDNLGLATGVNFRGEALYYIDYLKNEPGLKSIIEANKQEFISEKKPRIWCKYEWLLQQYEENNAPITSEVAE